MSDERNVEVHEIEDGHDRYDSLSEVLTLLPGDGLLPASGDVVLLQVAPLEAEQHLPARGVAYRVVEREFYYRDNRRAAPTEPYARRYPTIRLFVRRIPEDEYKAVSAAPR